MECRPTTWEPGKPISARKVKRYVDSVGFPLARKSRNRFHNHRTPARVLVAPSAPPTRPGLFAPLHFFVSKIQLCVIEPGAWRGMFPRVPSRSGGMVVVQTGILGTLLTGLFVSGARALAPEGERGYQAALSFSGSPTRKAFLDRRSCF